MRSSEQLAALTRRELQAEAKRHGVKANLASGEIVKQLLALGATASAAGGEGAAQSPREATAVPPAATGDEDAGASDPAPAPAHAPAADAAMGRADAGDLSRRLSKLSERIDRARLSLVAVQADAGDSEDESRRNSLDEELGLDFSPPKTTALLPATPKEKLRRSQGAPSITGFAAPSGTIPKTEPTGCLQGNPAKTADSVAKQDMCGTVQAASTCGRPWTPVRGSGGHGLPTVDASHHPAAAESPNGAASPPLPSSGTSSILQSAEYLRLRAERSERKRRRMEEGDECLSSSSSAAAESTQSFCKRIHGMCQQVTSIVTPHKNLALSSHGASGPGIVAPVLAAFGDAQNLSGCCQAPRADDARGEREEEQTCSGTLPTTPSGVSRSAKVSPPSHCDCGCLAWRQACLCEASSHQPCGLVCVIALLPACCLSFASENRS